MRGRVVKASVLSYSNFERLTDLARVVGSNPAASKYYFFV